jgi:hypothetical protein
LGRHHANEFSGSVVDDQCEGQPDEVPGQTQLAKTKRSRSMRVRSLIPALALGLFVAFGAGSAYSSDGKLIQTKTDLRVQLLAVEPRQLAQSSCLKQCKDRFDQCRKSGTATHTCMNTRDKCEKACRK